MKEIDLPEFDESLIEGDDADASDKEMGESHYFTGVIAGLGITVVMGFLSVAISMIYKGVNLWIVLGAAVVIGCCVTAASNRANIVTGIISAVCGFICVMMYVYIITMGGYTWEDGRSLVDSQWVYASLGALICGLAGIICNVKSDSETDDNLLQNNDI